ncbi:16S rRNA (cytosine(1402)-N(4))-methyltransferase RsmH [Candidatus Pelagibacter sp. HIMB123]|uniref:16S rRNA (cytosine(1402)-N(4))-methyltransferase RsmH n=1 Tax=Candidatus Pelagibacter sp. HIMB123 TaxID=3415413 RepID=UPI003F83DC5B
MDATIVPKMQKHYPVLLKEIISVISPQHGGTFIDCTFGQGGYTKKILDFENTNVIALDRDIESAKIANQLKESFKDRFIFKNIKFSQLNNLKLKNENIRGVIFDLGYSYTQIKDPEKGLSFEANGKLNMQLGLNNYSAEDVINKLDEKELEKIFKFFGDEKEAKYIARNINKERSKNDIDTKSLVEIIDKSKKRKNFKIHNATKVFQALRIFVNKEISELIYGLINATKVLKKGGILGVVTFHSLEDKIVKYFLKSLSENKSISRYSPLVKQADTLFNLIQKKPITPSEEELSENPPSRSAKFRYAIKKTDFYNFDTDIEEKFRNYIEIEKYGDKL